MPTSATTLADLTGKTGEWDVKSIIINNATGAAYLNGATIDSGGSAVEYPGVCDLATITIHGDANDEVIVTMVGGQ